jgi:hypothetical protein
LQDQLASTLKEAFPFAGARCARITEAVLARLPIGQEALTQKSTDPNI